MKAGFIGLGNVGRQLAGSLLKASDIELTVRDLDKTLAQPFIDEGAGWADSPAQLAEHCEVIITCLPSPIASAEVLEGQGGVLEGLSPGKIWIEMSTTDGEEIQRIDAEVRRRGGETVEAPVSGGCHRAATGNIAILAGGSRSAFEKVMPVLAEMGKDILHTGELGSASILKVITNYLAFANLVSVGEALTVAEKSGIDLGLAYEAIRVSSGNSFVHETESQVILNGSYNINFTMDLVLKDLSLFQAVADAHTIPLEISPLLDRIFSDGQRRFGARAWSSMIVKRLEEACALELRAPGFPAELVDDTPRVQGSEIRWTDGATQ
jgi:3-hydroxyisobutyrate dehydrogenase